MASAPMKQSGTEAIYRWEGKDKQGRDVHGELRASGAASASVALRRQGVITTRVRKKNSGAAKK